ncbi:hypothetical protein PHLCEN_2v13458 [Hermanssonia centrifuga]|uniref:Uncharacterized protein n=1 Tax=Hermanssonia centrifuga TaxID=98765 RepID=A0A2R6NE65_9APHY|nr:hypothetical protein PHLCEN_2v13458 [Hermanssonia centrifuga]
MEVLRQVHRELQVDQEDLDPDNNNEDSVEVPVSTAVGHSGAMEDSALGEQTEQVLLPPEDEGIPVDGKQVVGFVYMALTLQHGYPRTLLGLGQHMKYPSLVDHVWRFLYYQAHPNSDCSSTDLELWECPSIPNSQQVLVFHSACTTFYSPSDISGLGGMKSEHICSCPRWRGKKERRNCAFAQKDGSVPGIKGLFIVRVCFFFSFRIDGRRGTVYPCAFVEWFKLVGNERDPVTGMWMVEPDLDSDGIREVSVVHLDSLIRSAHLLAVFGDEFLPTDFHFLYTLDSFRVFYVNQFADHHANELLMV